MSVARTLNEADAAKLKEAGQDVTAQKMELALLLIEADGRLEQYQSLPWDDFPPIFRWMSHAIVINDELRALFIEILRMPHGQRPTETQTDGT